MTKTIKKIIYLLLGLAAGGIVWFATESLMIMNGGSFYLHLIITGGFIGAVYGAVIGLGEGIALSIKSKAANGALFGLIFGFIAGALAILIAQGLLFSVTGAGSASINDIQTSYLPKARIPGWTVLGGILGIIEGVRTKSLRRLLFGLAGGLVGGLAGGTCL